MGTLLNLDDENREVKHSQERVLTSPCRITALETWKKNACARINTRWGIAVKGRCLRLGGTN